MYLVRLIKVQKNTFLAAVGDRPEVWRHTVGPDTSHQHCRQHRLQHLHTCSAAGSAGGRCDSGGCSCGGGSMSCAGRQCWGPHTSTLSSPPSPPGWPHTPGLNPAKMSSTWEWIAVLNRAGRGCLMTKIDWQEGVAPNYYKIGGVAPKRLLIIWNFYMVKIILLKNKLCNKS